MRERREACGLRDPLDRISRVLERDRGLPEAHDAERMDRRHAELGSEEVPETPARQTRVGAERRERVSCRDIAGHLLECRAHTRVEPSSSLAVSAGQEKDLAQREEHELATQRVISRWRGGEPSAADRADGSRRDACLIVVGEPRECVT
jgi:hypothetical protein